MFRIEGNALGLQSALFLFQKNACRFTLSSAQTEYPLTCGLEAWQRGETALPHTPPRLTSGGTPKPGTKHKYAASGTWKDDSTFEMMLRYYETPHHDSVTCQFEGDQVKISFQSSIAKMNRAKDSRPVLIGQMMA